MTKRIKFGILCELAGRSKEEQLKIISELGSWLMKKQQSIMPLELQDVTDVEYEKSKSLKENDNETSNKATEEQISTSGAES